MIIMVHKRIIVRESEKISIAGRVGLFKYLIGLSTCPISQEVGVISQ